jgi:hypothetical protein
VTWKAYQVVFKLKSPMHIGCGKIGNVQRTRPYVTGRVFWGALTLRLTRNKHQPATDSKQYQDIGGEVHQQLAYTYFYPATKSKERYDIALPWQADRLFYRRFLSSYTSTALVYPQQAADEGLLHEVEFISPRTLDEGKQVYLIGYVFEKEGCVIKWKNACKRLQMGGERGYGWGAVDCNPEKDIEEMQSTELFDRQACFIDCEDRPIIQQTGRLLAHAKSTGLTAKGEIEPLVGREWRSNNSTNRYAGQHIEFCDLCWIPGSFVERSHSFEITEFGIWKAITAPQSISG